LCGYAQPTGTLTSGLTLRDWRRDPPGKEVIVMRSRVARWMAAGLLGAALALGSMAPNWIAGTPSALASDPGNSGGGGG
jgi:hypothetical protein